LKTLRVLELNDLGPPNERSRTGMELMPNTRGSKSIMPWNAS
jgi:hypothetical protein